MIKIKARALSKEAFSEFGDYYDFLSPIGHSLGNFYHDHVMYPVSGEMPIGFSGLIAPVTEMIVKKVEFHNKTSEAILPLDGDVIVHVAPPSAEPIPEKTQAFIVPKGTMVRLNTAVWHLCPMPIENKDVHLLITLPERTYYSDCAVVEYSPNQYVEIER